MTRIETVKELPDLPLFDLNSSTRPINEKIRIYQVHLIERDSSFGQKALLSKPSGVQAGCHAGWTCPSEWDSKRSS